MCNLYHTQYLNQIVYLSSRSNFFFTFLKVKFCNEVNTMTTQAHKCTSVYTYSNGYLGTVLICNILDAFINTHKGY